MFLADLFSTPRRTSSSSVKSVRLRHQKSTSPDASPNRRQRSPDASSSLYIADDAQLRPVPPLPAETIDLNKSLEILTSVFPDVQVEVFREMLSSFSEESRLAVIADAMLKSPAQYVKGRRRLRGEPKQHARSASVADDQLVPRSESYRADEYKAAVRSLALNEFKGLSRSAIDAVLSESNYSYFDARPTLVNLSTKSWKFTIQSIFRRKPVTTGEAENHPLVVWKSSGRGSIMPTIKSTGNPELDRELFEELIIPLQKREAALREERDHEMALQLNTEEAEAYQATYECACCYADVTFEGMTTCSADGHMVCFQCVQHSITEAVFGQGWIKYINKDNGTLRCPAVSSSECEGCISSEHIYRAMQEQKNGAEILHKMDQRLAEHELIASKLPLIRCPFCNYAEVDDLYVPRGQRRLRFRASNIPNAILMLLNFFVFPMTAPLMIIGLIGIAIYCAGVLRSSFNAQFRTAVTRCRRRRMGLKFSCQNPECRRPSCMSCGKVWTDVHVCHESALVALRTQVEQAMSMAVKRVCPRCGTSFVKTAGCNKLTCPCGYKMCYVCRRDIGAATEGYSHFCQHFRPEGDGSRCTECAKCNLWETEDTEAILREAKVEAERKWREMEKRDLSGAERAYLETGVASKRDDVISRVVRSSGKVPSFGEICDAIIEALFVI
jgi:hypothetical protein